MDKGQPPPPDLREGGIVVIVQIVADCLGPKSPSPSSGVNRAFGVGGLNSAQATEPIPRPRGCEIMPSKKSIRGVS